MYDLHGGSMLALVLLLPTVLAFMRGCWRPSRRQCGKKQYDK